MKSHPFRDDDNVQQTANGCQYWFMIKITSMIKFDRSFSIRVTVNNSQWWYIGVQLKGQYVWSRPHPAGQRIGRSQLYHKVGTYANSICVFLMKLVSVKSLCGKKVSEIKFDICVWLRAPSAKIEIKGLASIKTVLPTRTDYINLYNLRQKGARKKTRLIITKPAVPQRLPRRKELCTSRIAWVIVHGHLSQIRCSQCVRRYANKLDAVPTGAATGGVGGANEHPTTLDPEPRARVVGELDNRASIHPTVFFPILTWFSRARSPCHGSVV